MNEVEVYYQPEYYYDDGTNISWGNIPDELNSFEVFRNTDEVKEWLEEYGYDPGDFNIVEYTNDDIEDHTYVYEEE